MHGLQSLSRVLEDLFGELEPVPLLVLQVALEATNLRLELCCILMSVTVGPWPPIGSGRTTLVVEDGRALIRSACLDELKVALLLQIVALLDDALEARLPANGARVMRGEPCDCRARVFQFTQKCAIGGLGHLCVYERLGELLRESKRQ